jgi:hypothetical protein
LKSENKRHWITASNKILNVVQNIKRITFSQIIVTITNKVVTARPNLPYIVRFGPYRTHGFVPGDVSPLLSLTPQNMYDKVATSTLNKASYHSLTRRCGILQSTPLKEPDDPVGTTRQPVRSNLIPNVTTQPNLPYIVCFGPYCPHGFVPGDVSPLLSLTPQNVYDKLTTSTLNKASYHSLTRQCGILQRLSKI